MFAIIIFLDYLSLYIAKDLVYGLLFHYSKLFNQLGLPKEKVLLDYVSDLENSETLNIVFLCPEFFLMFRSDKLETYF